MLFKQTNIINCVNDIESYISAKDHFGHQSPALVRHYTEDLGFEYLSASAKEEFEQVYSRFITPELTDKPMIFEVFTKVEDENEALKQMWNIEKSAKQKIKQSIKSVLSDDVIDLGKKFFGKN